MDDDKIPIEYELVRDGLLFDEIEVIETHIGETPDDVAVRMELRAEEDLVQSTGFALIYVLALLSFADARPRGVSGHWYEDDDQFTAADMLRHLRFEGHSLHLYVDYLRGRCLKTTVEIFGEGRVRLETANRGKAATRWVDRIKGKKFLKPVEGG